MIKGIIFDLGGPIVDYDSHAIYDRHSTKHGLDRKELHELLKEFYRGVHVGEYASVEDFFKKAKPTLAITVEELNGLFAERDEKRFIRPEIIELITKLKKKYKIALLSNFGSDLTRLLKEVFQIYHLFDLAVNSYDIKIAKPDVRAYQYVLDKIQLHANETIFIDDKEENVDAARGMGIKGIIFQNSKQCMTELKTHLGVSDF